MRETVVVVGAGQAGGMAVALLRQSGYQGRVVLVGEEPVPPYQRPPLSKAYFKGEMTAERLYLRPLAFYEKNAIELRLGLRAEAINRDAKKVMLSDGSMLPYDKLILAVGSKPRQLPVPGNEYDGIFELRTLEDVDRLRSRAGSGKKMVIVGAGYIGLEAAAVARHLGMSVTVLEAAPRVLARVTSPPVSEFFENEHRAKGVDIRLESQVARFIGSEGRLVGVELTSGEVVEAGLALIGIGILPNVGLAEDAGLDCQDGIVVNEDGQSSDPDVFAIGDCTSRPLVHYDRMGRLESIHNAGEQAKLAASVITGKPRPRCDVPWFWSDQYDLKLQSAGLSVGYDQLVLRGASDSRSFAIYYFKDHKCIAVDAVNSPADFMFGKALLNAGEDLDADMISSSDVDIKALTSKLGKR